jgi:hypothetical protein
MKIDVLKSEFHNLIDQIDNPELPEQFYDAISLSIKPDNYSWKSLSTQQTQEVLNAYEDSEDETKVIPSSDIKSKYTAVARLKSGDLY